MAIDSFEKAMSVDLSGLGDIEKDTMQNGQVQKFEISLEQFWKTMKKFLHDIHGIEAVSPKTTIKQLYLTKYTDEHDYETLLGMINDRNRLSHVYNENQFNEIYSRLSEYLSLMKKIVAAINA
jgi:nucleotidyltransferase substrate binding protein (TIGR01987 family)